MGIHVRTIGIILPLLLSACAENKGPSYSADATVCCSALHGQDTKTATKSLNGIYRYPAEILPVADAADAVLGRLLTWPSVSRALATPVVADDKPATATNSGTASGNGVVIAAAPSPVNVFGSHPVAHPTVLPLLQGQLELVRLQRALGIAQARLQLLQQQQQLQAQSSRVGLVSTQLEQQLLDQRLQAQSQQAQLQQQLTDKRRDVALLQPFGIAPLAESIDYPDLPSLSALPEQTLQRRQDLQQAYQALAPLPAYEQLPYNELLPRLNIRQALLLSSQSPERMLLDSPVWLTLTKKTWPLLRPARLRTASEAPQLRVAGSYDDYRKVLIAAVADVGENVRREQQLANQQQRQAALLNSTLAEAAGRWRQFQAGLLSRDSAVEGQLRAMEQEALLNDICAERLQNRLLLGQALGLPFYQ